jgi:Tat protein translocase TatB subunit
MFGIGMTEMIVIFVIALVVLGPKRLPELARTLGRTLAEFRRTATDLRREFSDVADDARIAPPTRIGAAPKPASSGDGAPPEPEASPGEGGQAGGGRPGDGGPAVG